jgi:hypothetical protein
LLIGENAQGSSHLVNRLGSHGCQCSFARSYQEVISLCAIQDFELVLSPLRVHDTSYFRLMSLLDGSVTYLFYYQPVEDSCWWLPALRSGQKCFGSDALRPGAFAVRLEEMIEEIRARPTAIAKSLPSMPPAVLEGINLPIVTVELRLNLAKTNVPGNTQEPRAAVTFVDMLRSSGH